MCGAARASFSRLTASSCERTPSNGRTNNGATSSADGWSERWDRTHDDFAKIRNLHDHWSRRRRAVGNAALSTNKDEILVVRRVYLRRRHVALATAHAPP